jgi:copper transporter 1
LASSWHVKSRGAFAASCIGVALLVVVLEALRRAAREYDVFLAAQFQRHVAAQAKARAVASPSTSTSVTFRASAPQQLVRAVLHAAQFGLAYLLMLLAMYFNGYIFLSLVVGAGLGKFLCDWLEVTIGIAAQPPCLPGGAAPPKQQQAVVVASNEAPTCCA